MISGFIIYTNGSVTARTLNGGVTEGDTASPRTLLTKQERGAATDSSYDKEKAAMRTTLEWLSPSALTTHRFLKRSRVALPTLQT